MDSVHLSSHLFDFKYTILSLHEIERVFGMPEHISFEIFTDGHQFLLIDFYLSCCSFPISPSPTSTFSILHMTGYFLPEKNIPEFVDVLGVTICLGWILLNEFFEDGPLLDDSLV
jgi:hypothetical protein